MPWKILQPSSQCQQKITHRTGSFIDHIVDGFHSLNQTHTQIKSNRWPSDAFKRKTAWSNKKIRFDWLTVRNFWKSECPGFISSIRIIFTIYTIVLAFSVNYHFVHWNCCIIILIFLGVIDFRWTCP